MLIYFAKLRPTWSAFTTDTSRPRASGIRTSRSTGAKGENFADAPGSPSSIPLAEGVRSSIYVNLLTEDNLPYYTHTLLSNAPRTIRSSTGITSGRWRRTATRWSCVTGCTSVAALIRRCSKTGAACRWGRAKSPSPTRSLNSSPTSPFRSARPRSRTVTPARNCPRTTRLVVTCSPSIAGDETKHYLFYRDLALAAFAIDPSTMMIAAAKQAAKFAMPGTGIPSFTRHAVRIAREGIYGLKQFLRDVLDPVLGLWDVDHLAGLSAEAEKARQELAEFVSKLSDGVERMAQKAAGATALLT